MSESKIENGQPTLQQHYVMGSGYVCSIEGEKIIVVAINIADCMEQLEIMANGKKYQMETHSSMSVCYCP
jgi:hypothetical protein